MIFYSSRCQIDHQLKNTCNTDEFQKYIQSCDNHNRSICNTYFNLQDVFNGGIMGKLIVNLCTKIVNNLQSVVNKHYSNKNVNKQFV